MNDIKTYLNFIDGQMVPASGGQTIDCLNPATGEIVGRVQNSGVRELNQAVLAADRAFHQADWRYNPGRRAAALMKYADRLEAESEGLARLLTLNNGKILNEARGEVAGCIDGVRYFAGLARNIFGKSLNISENSMSVLLREPLGVVGAIAPFNWPCYLLFRGMLPALAAGCAVVAKPATATGAATGAMIDILAEIEEIPAGIVNAVTGPGATVGDALARHPLVGLINFTGDEATGVEVARAAAPGIKRLSLELGGKSPNVVFDDADMDKALPAAVWAFLATAGQLCMAGTRLVLQEGIYDEFLKKLVAEVEKFKVGNGLEDGVMMGPMINQAQFDKVMGFIELGRKEGRVVTGGGRPAGSDPKGLFIAPTIVTDLPPESDLVQKEIFGPVLVVQKFKTDEEAMAIANGTRFGLAAAVWTRDVNRAVRVSREIKAGTVWVNTYNKFYFPAEFGGYKASGVGRGQGEESVLECTEIKHLNFDIQPTYF